MSDHSDPPRVELRVRDHTSPDVYDRQKAVYERLRQLQKAGKVGDVSVEVWGKRVRAGDNADRGETDDGAQSIRETYRAFEDWAIRSGHTLTPAFDIRECGTIVSNETYEVIVFPVMCLAIYDGETIQEVFPCSTGDGVRTVEDGLTMIDAGLAHSPSHPA